MAARGRGEEGGESVEVSLLVITAPPAAGPTTAAVTSTPPPPLTTPHNPNLLSQPSSSPHTHSYTSIPLIFSPQHPKALPAATPLSRPIASVQPPPIPSPTSNLPLSLSPSLALSWCVGKTRLIKRRTQTDEIKKQGTSKETAEVGQPELGCKLPQKYLTPFRYQTSLNTSLYFAVKLCFLIHFVQLPDILVI